VSKQEVNMVVVSEIRYGSRYPGQAIF